MPLVEVKQVRGDQSDQEWFYTTAKYISSEGRYITIKSLILIHTVNKWTTNCWKKTQLKTKSIYCQSLKVHLSTFIYAFMPEAFVFGKFSIVWKSVKKIRSVQNRNKSYKGSKLNSAISQIWTDRSFLSWLWRSHLDPWSWQSHSLWFYLYVCLSQPDNKRKLISLKLYWSCTAIIQNAPILSVLQWLLKSVHLYIIKMNQFQYYRFWRTAFENVWVSGKYVTSAWICNLSTKGIKYNI